MSKKKVIVISLGGSLIIPEKIDVVMLGEFKKVILKNSKRYKFVIVCGGGSIARTYIGALKSIKSPERLQCLAGISATRMNARFMAYFFGMEPKEGIPHDISWIRRHLEKQDIIFCGSLKYAPNQTSDSTAAEIAHALGADFVNITNVAGLFDKDPSKYKNAKFIPYTSWSKFHNIASKIKYKPGQHFILDQTASRIIMEHKVVTYLLGKKMKELDNLLNGKKFKGTTISF